MADFSTVRLTIDLNQLQANYRHLQRMSKGARVAAVVKANAYGLGLLGVVNALTAIGCNEFFVANLTEAQIIRGVHPSVRIYVLEGAAKDSALCLALGLTPVLNSWAEWLAWRQVDPKGLWVLQLDTGIGRAGIDEADWFKHPEYLHALQQHSNVCLLTQFAVAEQPAHPMNDWQRLSFDRMHAAVPQAQTSKANSGGIFLGKAYHGDLVRPGLALYGGQPSSVYQPEIKPVLRIDAEVLQIKTLTRAQPVGYGATRTLNAGDTLATLGVGYADGYARERDGEAFVLWQGHVCPLVGRVSMDLMTVLVPPALTSQPAVGDSMTLLGASETAEISLEQLARFCQRSTHSVLTGWNATLPRDYRT